METLSDTNISYSEAIEEAIRMEMGRDPNVVCVDSGAPGHSSAGRLEQLFGGARVVALDRAERTSVGIAVGMALEGSRPICELTASELPSRGLDQLAEAAELHRREDVQVPLVVRVRCGEVAHPRADEGPERWLLPIAGLSVLAPAGPADAKGLLVSAIRDSGPTCFLEEATLENEVGPVPEGGHVVPIGEARLLREGARATLIAHGTAVAAAVAAVDELDDGIEVLDLRTLAPLDEERITASVRRTGKALLVEETTAISAVTRMVTATISDHAFEYLDAPPRRVSLANDDADTDDPATTRMNAIKKACDELLAY